MTTATDNPTCHHCHKENALVLVEYRVGSAQSKRHLCNRCWNEWQEQYQYNGWTNR